MGTKRIMFKSLGVLMALAILMVALPVLTVQAQTTRYVDLNYGSNTPGWETTHFATIQSAIDAASSGDTITVAAGTYTEDVTVNKPITLVGAGRDDVTIQGVGTGESAALVIAADDVTFEGFTIQGAAGGRKTVRVTTATINLEFLNNKVVTADNSGEDNAWSGFETTGTQTDHIINGNIFIGNKTAQLIYFNPNTVGLTFTNNTIEGTVRPNGLVAGFEGLDGTQNISGNTFDIESDYAVLELFGTFDGEAIFAANTFPDGYVLIVNKVVKAPPVYNVTQGTYFDTIQSAIDAASSGDTIEVAPGTYDEDININKSLTLKSESGADNTLIRGQKGGNNATIRVSANDVIIDGFTITRVGNNLAEWNDSSLKTAGIAIINRSNSGLLIKNNIIIGNRTGIDVNNTSYVTIQNNEIIDNRTGLLFRNETNYLTVINNEITDNWTIGILFLDMGGTPPQTAHNSVFNNNNLSGNWYGQVEDRQLPDAEETNFKDFSSNWWGSTNLTITSEPAGEPGYADLIPVKYGGTATPPDFAPAIVGIASSNILFCPVLDAPPPVGEVYYSVENADTGEKFCTIQTGIDAASVGETLIVSPGTYNELLIVDKPLTLLGPNAGIHGTSDRTSEAEIIGPSNMWLSIYVSSENVVIDGFTINGINLDPGNYYTVGLYSVAGDFILKNNIFTNNNGMSILTSGGSYASGNSISGVMIIDNLITNEYPSDDPYNFGIYLQSTLASVTGNFVENMRSGIQIQPYNIPGYGLVENNTFLAYARPLWFNYAVHVDSNWEIKNNLISGIATPSSIEERPFNAIRVETFYNGNVSFTQNRVLFGEANSTEQNLYRENNVTNGISNASPNWWGNIAGPKEAFVTLKDTSYIPWCGDPECSFLVYPNEKGELVLEGTINLDGGVKVDVDGVTILVKDGTIIKNVSPCFEVTANNVTILGESEGGATCVPTGTSAGVEVADGVETLTVKGLHFDGSETSGPAIHFAGNVQDIQVLDNLFEAFSPSALVFDGAVDKHFIQGNLFLNVGAPAIISTTEISAAYNSWGVNEAPVISGVTTTPFTHVDLWVLPVTTQVLQGEDITFTVMADMQNIAGAEFDLIYPTDLLTFSGFSDVTVEFMGIITGDDPETQADLLTHSLGVISFRGTYDFTDSEAGPVSGEDLVLFRATFTASETLTRFDTLGLVELPQGFAMSPDIEHATNYVYPLLAEDVAVSVVAPPVITSEDIEGYYLVDELREFKVKMTNPAEGGTYELVLFRFEVEAVDGDITLFQYKADENWLNMPLDCVGGTCVGYYGSETGFPLGTNYESETTFRIQFAKSGAYPVVITLEDLNADNHLLASLEAEPQVYAVPVISSDDLAGPYVVDITQEFKVAMTNPADGGTYEYVLFHFEVKAEDGDIAVFQYKAGENWLDMPLTCVSGTCVGYYGPSGGFKIEPNYFAETTFRVQFAETGTYPVDVTLVDLDMDERVLAEFDDDAIVIDSEQLVGRVMMQGRYERGGVLFTLTREDTGFVTTAFSLSQLGQHNVFIDDVAEGLTYSVTVSQDRYLDVHLALDKVITLSNGQFILPDLYLYAGDVTNTNEVDIGDAALVGAQYGLTGAAISLEGDANFDGRVNIQDLALVGGNFRMTSGSAYSTWLLAD